MKSIKNPKLIVMDTMNFWIDHKKKQLLETIKKSDILIMNDGEARQLFRTSNLVQAANKALKMDSKAVIIKKKVSTVHYYLQTTSILTLLAIHWRTLKIQLVAEMFLEVQLLAT